MRVLTLTKPNGQTSFCDAKCHNSTRRGCTCVCRGLLHGYGKAYAKRNASRVHVYACLVAAQGAIITLNSELVPDMVGR